MMNTTLTSEHTEFLNDLRESGDTNMFGAGPYLQEAFDLDRNQARAILRQWMATFKAGDSE